MTKIEEILQKIENGILDLTQLRIQTVMGRLEVNQKNEIDFTAGQEIEGIISKIDLLDGDITTQITEKFYQKYPELVKFHQFREARGHEIIEGNMQALASIIATLRGMYNEKATP